MSGIGAGYIERSGEAYRGACERAARDAEDIGNVVVTTQDGVPIFLKDVAEVGIGRELRTGSRQRGRPGSRSSARP